MARWLHPGHEETVRVEHWTHAVEQAARVAHYIAQPGDQRAHRPVEYGWSDQYDWKIQIVGRPHRGAAHHVVGTTPTRHARGGQRSSAARTAAWRGAVTVNWQRASADCHRLVGAGAGLADALAAVAHLGTAGGR